MSDKILVEYEVSVNGLRAQMKEVQESFKATEKAGEDSAKGVSNEFKKAGESTKSLKTQLRELKAQLANATDPKEIERLAKAAGKLTDQLEDATDAAKVFASESKFEQVGNALGSIVSKLRNLDFKGAADQSKLLVSATKSITFSEALGGIKQLGSTLLNVGKSLLMNPIFLIGGAVTAIIANFDKLANSGGLVGKIFSFIGTAVDGVKNSFLTLTDAIGLTDTAANDAAENVQKYFDKVYERTKKQGDRLIALKKAQGKDTFNEEFTQIVKERLLLEDQFLNYKNNLARQGKSFDDFSEEEIKKIEEFGDRKADLSLRQSQLVYAKDKELKDKVAKDNKELNEKLIQQEKELRDLQASLIEDEKSRQLAELVNNFTDIKDSHKGQKDFLLALETKYQIDRDAIIKKYDDKEKADNEALFQEAIKVAEAASDKETKIYEDQYNEKKELRKRDAADAIEKEKETQQAIEQLRKSTFDFTSNLVSSLSQIQQNNIESQILLSQEQKDSEIADLDSQLSKKIITQEQYDIKKAAIEKKNREKERQLKIQAFEAQKQAAYIQTIISTAQGIANALTAQPVYVAAALAAIAAATGAAQLQVISSQPTPKFAKGVVDLKGSGTKNSDSIHAMLSRGESVITADATATDRALFEAFNKGKGKKYIYEMYVAPALKEQLKKHNSSKDSDFASSIANSMILNSGSFKDSNILDSLKMSRMADKENIKLLVKAIKQNNYNPRSW